MPAAFVVMFAVKLKVVGQELLEVGDTAATTPVTWKEIGVGVAVGFGVGVALGFLVGVGLLSGSSVGVGAEVAEGDGVGEGSLELFLLFSPK